VLEGVEEPVQIFLLDWIGETTLTGKAVVDTLTLGTGWGWEGVAVQSGVEELVGKPTPTLRIVLPPPIYHPPNPSNHLSESKPIPAPIPAIGASQTESAT